MTPWFVAGVSRFFLSVKKGHTLSGWRIGRRLALSRCESLTAPMIPILWQSPHCLVVFKPAGLATQAPAPHDSLERRLRAELEPSDGAAGDYLALPHRLDRAVSGVILVARTKRAARLLGQQFQSRKVTKTYLAWVHGQPHAEPQRWVDWLRKLPGQPRTEVVAPSVPDDPSSGQEAITEVRMLRQQADSALLELQPLTGRMHQLRVQCAHRGHPILGDSLYGSSETWAAAADRPETHISGAETIALHAWKLSFYDPRNGQAVSVEAPPAWPTPRLP